MAELGVIASIVGLAGVGIKLSKHLYQVGQKISNPGHNINRVATNVSLFAAMLKHVGAVLDNAQSLHSPEAIETVKQIVRECETVFQEITRLIVLAKDKSDEGTKEPTLANGSKRRFSMVARAKWYFERPKAECLLAQLEYLKTTLSVLLQTLALAALTAKVTAELGTSEKRPEIVQQERLHVETLIVAQQLSVHTLRDTQDKLEAESTRPSTPSEDSSLEQKYPKLLEQGSASSLQMIKLGGGDLEFTDRRPSVAHVDGAPLEPTTSHSDAFIDELLTRWTLPPEIKYQPPQMPFDIDGEEVDRQATPVPTTVSSRPGPEALRKSNSTPVPRAPSQISKSTEIVPASPPTPNRQSQDLMSPRSDAATLASRDPASTRGSTSQGYASPALSSVPSRVLSPRSALERSYTNPESGGFLVLNDFNDHHGLQQNYSARTNRAGTPSIPALSIPQDSRIPVPYHRGALAPYMAGAAAASGNANLSPGWSNYRQPYVSDEDADSTWTPSDSEDSRPNSRAGKPFARSRRDSNVSNVSRASRRTRHVPHDSGHGGDAGDGLGIPWRIRLSPGKHFDFRDDILIGPRTSKGYLPSESRSSIYGNDAAATEISKEWVCEEALVEMRYPHTELRENHEGQSVAGEEGGWRILQPLKFVSHSLTHPTLSSG